MDLKQWVLDVQNLENSLNRELHIVKCHGWTFESSQAWEKLVVESNRLSEEARRFFWVMNSLKEEVESQNPRLGELCDNVGDWVGRGMFELFDQECLHDKYGVWLKSKESHEEQYQLLMKRRKLKAA